MLKEVFFSGGSSWFPKVQGGGQNLPALITCHKKFACVKRNLHWHIIIALTLTALNSGDVSCVTCDTLLCVCCDIMPLPGSENAAAKCNSVIFLFELYLCFSYCDLLECPLTKVYFAPSSVTDQWASAQLYCSVRSMKLLLFENSFSPDITVSGHYSLQWII